MTLVDDDEVEEVTGNAFEDFVLVVRPGQGLVKAKVDLVGGIDLPVLDLGHDRAEGLKVVHQGLVG